jgi:hypothetical protein
MRFTQANASIQVNLWVFNGVQMVVSYQCGGHQKWPSCVKSVLLMLVSLLDYPLNFSCDSVTLQQC